LFASKILVQEMTALAPGEIRDRADSQALRLIGLREVSDASAALLTGEEQYARAARLGSATVRDRVALLKNADRRP